MKKLYLLGWLCCCLSLTGFAQTEKQLENAVRIHNTIQEQIGKPEVKAEDLFKLEDNCEALLTAVVQNGSAEEKRAARYFLAVITQLRAETYFLQPGTANAKRGSEILKSQESEFDRLDESAFPFSYQFGGKSYTVAYTDFLPARQRYYGEMAEMYYNAADDVLTRKYALKALAMQPAGFYYVAYHLRNFLYVIAKTYPERAEQARQLISLYAQLEPAQREDLNKRKIGDQLIKNVSTLFLTGQNVPAAWDKSGAESLTIAGEMRTANLDTLAGKFYGQALDKGQVFSVALSWDLLQYFDNKNFKLTGLKVANKLLPQLAADNCADLLRLADYFKKFGDPDKARSVRQSGERCQNEVEQKAQAEQKRRERAARRENRGHMYLGAYVLRIIQRPEYIDLGGALNIPLGRTMLEFSYLKARNDQDYLLSERFGKGEDLNDFTNPHWDGFYAHFAYKKLQKGRSKSRSYGGFLLSYNQRNFQPQFSEVLDKTTNLPVAYAVAFEPVVTSYGAMLNFGELWQKSPLGADFYFGIGANYNQFDLQNATYSRDQYALSNPFLNQRKDAYWGLQIRLGLTVGLSL